MRSLIKLVVSTLWASVQLWALYWTVEHLLWWSASSLFRSCKVLRWFRGL